jgi:catechol 2,3-dioxygenase-like lactoylglutathione lyase family enzyme
MYPSSLKTKITTARLAETRDFYVGCLGMRVVEEFSDEGGVGCILALAEQECDAVLEIHEGPQPKDLSGLSLQFRSHDLEAFKTSLPAGTKVRGPVPRPWGSTYLYLTDPNGISVVVFQHGH